MKTINCIFGPLIRSFNKDEENLVGNIELIYVVVETLAHRIVGLISLLTAPVMKCMAHSVPSIRQLASVTFGMLVTLMPLEKSFPTELADDLKLVWNENYQFLSALMHPSVLHMSQLPFALNGVSLRSYQLEGISWISFLAQYGLHGILCDDMGRSFNVLVE